MTGGLLKGVKRAAEAFARIAHRGVRFIFRGDASGTQYREKQLWGTAGLIPSWRWYVESGAAVWLAAAHG